MEMSARKLFLTKEQNEFLNQNWEGTEWCPNCNMETDFVFNPMKQQMVKCCHCGKEIHPCSLCDSGKGCSEFESCEDTIKASLLHYCEEWNDEVNEKY